MKKFLKDHKLNIFLLISLVIVTYINALQNGFVSDDIAEIVQNPSVGNFSYIFTHPFGFIRIALNWFAFHIGGLNPLFFRLINYFFHTGNVFLIYILLNLIFSRKIALLAAAIFAVHPAISEPVVWISGGTYPQYSFFFLLSFILYLLSKQTKKLYLLSIIIFSFAFMSHPVMPLALFLIFPLYEFCFGNIKKEWLKTIPYLLVAIIYVFINLGALSERETTLQSVHLQEKGIDNPVYLIPVAVSSYLQLLIWPKDLTLYHSELSFGQIEFLIRLILTLLIFVVLIVSFKKSKPVFFWGSFSLLALIPTLTPFRLNWIVAERYFYLPSIGIFTLFSLGLNKLIELKKFKPIAYSIFVIIIILLSGRTIMRNIDWKNEDNLWIATGKTSPSSPNNHNNLGDVYGRAGDKEKALQEFQTAIALKPNYADAFHNLANTYRELGQNDKALENYQNALKYNPKLWQSYQNIAAIYFGQKEYEGAVEYVQKAITINPKNLNLYLNLGVLYLVKGDKEKAKQVFTMVLQANPQNQLAKQGLIEANR